MVWWRSFIVPSRHIAKAGRLFNQVLIVQRSEASRFA